ncbi:hypothetical protein [Burkholderia stabilis]|uniref:hypothetical protein n=1 Tax=Burkholderia stabilis TaxID=95485 RepID=UPI0015921222|nr:hypothetical protein [Burkholderia stabilis]
MDGLIELIFDRVPGGNVDKLVNDFLQGGDILGISHSELGSLDPKTVNRYLMPILRQETDFSSVFIRTANAMIGNVSIRSPLVRILRFEGGIEVAIVFDSADIEATDRQGVVTKLAVGAAALASSAGVPEYYCGFEPANDEKTRLFTRGKIGPLVTV